MAIIKESMELDKSKFLQMYVTTTSATIVRNLVVKFTNVRATWNFIVNKA